MATRPNLAPIPLYNRNSHHVAAHILRYMSFINNIINNNAAPPPNRQHLPTRRPKTLATDLFYQITNKVLQKRIATTHLERKKLKRFASAQFPIPTSDCWPFLDVKGVQRRAAQLSEVLGKIEARVKAAMREKERRATRYDALDGRRRKRVFQGLVRRQQGGNTGMRPSRLRVVCGVDDVSHDGELTEAPPID